MFKFEIKKDKFVLYFDKNENFQKLDEFYINETLLDNIENTILELEKAKKRIKEILQKKKFNPLKIWNQLKETNSIEEMASIFNSLKEEQRKKVADFILTNVNIFKEPGTSFVKYYDPNSSKINIP